MALALGIDTGGTFTDSVIYDLDSKKIMAKAKALTTYDDLTLGIGDSIAKLSCSRLEEIKLVCLSTTLATNAIVQGRGSEVALILIGESPAGPLPLQHYELVGGGHDIQGFPKEELDVKKVEEALAKFKGKVEAIAVSGFASVRNPGHELKVKELIQDSLDLPVVCGHELTTSLGFYERTVTAVLNAKLIPIITGLIASVKKALHTHDIAASLMIVKGNGALMSEAMALARPIETILSGPAASLIGAGVLTNTSEALVLDMGGTTTDIAVAKNGVPRLNRDGATVGGWRTRVEAADIHTYGLGGDSEVWINKDQEIKIGPHRVWPLAYLGSKYSYIAEELKLQGSYSQKLKPSSATGVFVLVKEGGAHLNQREKRAVELLRSGPHTLYYLAEALQEHPLFFELEGLVQKGIVAKAALTPTDILHAMGKFNPWSTEAARQGIAIIGKLMGKTVEAVIDAAYEAIIDSLTYAVLESALSFEGGPAKTVDTLKGDYMIKKMFSVNRDDLIHTSMKLSIPIVGIGAPVQAYLPGVAERLKARLIIPDNADVANAVGAATGKVMERVEMTIDPSLEGYFLYSQWERKLFADIATARDYALEEAAKQASLLAEKAGAVHYEVIKNCRDIYANGETGIHVKTIVEATVIGRPWW